MTIEAIIDYQFQDQTLLETALTHASFDSKNNYERLEFLGDRVLGLVLSEWLYELFPNEPEGDMAKRLSSLAQGSFLAGLSTKLNLGKHIKISDTEQISGGRDNPHILADIFESILGAMYLDGGFAPAERFVKSSIGDAITNMQAPPQHPKTRLQEWAQGGGLALPEYTTIEKSGLEHEPQFIVEVASKDKKAQGAGNSLAAAQKAAAQEFIAKYL